MRIHYPIIARVLIVAGLLAGLAAACGPASGGSVRIEEVWSRPAVAEGTMGAQAGMANQNQMAGQAGMAGPMPGTGAVYMVVSNTGSEPDRLTGGKTDVAQVVEIHETRMEGDVMSMVQMANGLEIPAGGQVALKPGGYHVMLIGLKQDLKVGDRFEVVLEFEKAGAVTVESEVREP